MNSLKIQKCTRNCNATGCELPNGGFIVFKGSVIASLETPSCPNWVKRIRLKLNLKQNVLQEHTVFNSISAASSAVSGSSSNGNDDWS